MARLRPSCTLLLAGLLLLPALGHAPDARSQNMPAMTNPDHQMPSASFTRQLGAMPAVPEAAFRRVINGYPYWEAGILDKKLSNACVLGQFNQAVRNRSTIGFNGIDRMPLIGAAVLGFASAEWNLSDPGKQAEAGTSYYFYEDGTPNCQVFRWKADEKRRKLGAQIYPAGPQRRYIDNLYDFVQ